MTKEMELAAEVEEFFNESDASVGIYPVGVINKEVVEEFENAFQGIKIVSYGEEEVEFEVEEGSRYKLILSRSYERWQLLKVIVL